MLCVTTLNTVEDLIGFVEARGWFRQPKDLIYGLTEEVDSAEGKQFRITVVLARTELAECASATEAELASFREEMKSKLPIFPGTFDVFAET